MKQNTLRSGFITGYTEGKRTIQMIQKQEGISLILHLQMMNGKATWLPGEKPKRSICIG